MAGPLTISPSVRGATLKKSSKGDQMRSAADWAQMYSKHVASVSPEELEAFAATIQLDAVASSGDEMERAVAHEIDRLRVRAAEYPDELFER